MTRRFLQNVRVLAATELVLRLKGLLLMPLLSKYFGAPDYGVWAQVTVIVSLLSPLLVLGLDSAVLRFLPGTTPQEIRDGFASVFTFLTAISIPLALMLWLASGPIANAFFATSNAGRFVALSGVMAVVSLLLNQCRNFFRVVGNAAGYATLALSQAASGLIVGAGIAVYHGTVWQLVLFTFLGDFVVLVAGVIVIVVRDGMGTPHWSVTARYLRYGLPLAPTGYAMVALNSSDRLFIVHYGNLADVGVYAIVYSLGFMLISLFFGPIWLMYPSHAAEFFNRGDLQGVRHLYRQVTNAALGLLIPCTIGVAVLARPLIRLIASEQFVRGAPLVPIITAAYVLHMMASFYDVNLGLVGRQRWVTISMVIAMLANISLNFVFVPWLGIMGAAITTFLAFGVQFAISAYVGSRELRLPFDFVFLAKSVFASAIMGMSVAILPLSRSFWNLGIAVAFGGALYVSMLLVFRAVSLDQLRAVLFDRHRSVILEPGSAEFVAER